MNQKWYNDALSKMPARILEAIDSGMVTVDIASMSAAILTPPNPDGLTDDDWLAILRAASEVGRELEQLGFTVSY